MKINSILHQEVILELDKLAQNKYDYKQRQWVQKYLGSNKPTRCIKSVDIKKIAKEYTSDIYLIDSLYRHGTTFDEFAVAASMVKYQKVSINNINNWLNFCVGWAEVDSLCQSNFEAKQVLPDWSKWQRFLIKLSESTNINKRRASLVLLCKTLGQSDDSRVFDFSLELIDRLKFEKEILITKAISWVLRQMVKHHPDELAEYLEANKDSLPKIAYREAIKKLTTGKKN